MDLHTRISRIGGATVRLRLYRAGSRAWLVALTGVLAALMLLAIPVAPARAQNGPEVDVGQSPSGGGTVRVGKEVFAGDGCVRTGDVAVGECGKDSGKAKGNDGHANKDASGGNTGTPEETSDRSQYGGGGTTIGEATGGGPSSEEDASGTTGTTGSGKPDEITGGTTVMATTDQTLDESTRRTLPGSEITGPEGTGSTVAGEPDVCPAAPPKDAQTATVARAVDGDTVELQEPVDGYDRVRLIGMDTPELDGKDAGPEPGAEEAKAYTAEALEGKEIALETDQEVEGPYGRLLAYVWIPGSEEANVKADANQPEFFNRTLIADGYAETMTVEPNDAYAECLAAATNEPKDESLGTTGDTTRDGGANKDENEGLLGRLQDLVSSKERSGGQTATNKDKYGQGGTTGGTTGGPLPEETVPEEGFQGGTLQEDTALASTTGGEPGAKTDGAARDQTSQGDNPPPETGGTDGSMELQEPDTQEPEAQEPEIQGPPARGGELGTGSELADPAPDDPASEELAVPQPPQPAGTDTELDTGTDTPTDTGSVADQAQLTTLPETSGVPLTRLAALPAGVLLICSGLFAALTRVPQETRRNGSGG